MIYAAILIHILLTFINYKISKSFIYPPTTFTLLWTVLLCLLVLSGDFFYQISEFTLLIFVIGSLAFSIGGWMVSFFKIRTLLYVKPAREWERKLLDWILVLVLILLPFYYFKIAYLSDLSGVDDFWKGIRAQTSTGDKTQESFGIFAYLGNLVSIASVASLSLYLKGNYSKKKTYLFISAAILFGLLSAGRSGPFLTVLSILFILIMNRKFQIKSFLIFSVILFLLFTVPAVLLGKGVDIEANIIENLKSLKETIQIYALGGLVAFDNSVSNPNSIESGGLTFIFFIKVMKFFGSEIQAPASILDYTETPWLTNVYTLYFPYYSDMGITGVFLIMVLLGLILTYFYRKTLLGRPEYALLSATGFAMILLSSIGDGFFATLSLWFQVAIFSFLLYKFPFFIYSTKSARLNAK